MTLLEYIKRNNPCKGGLDAYMMSAHKPIEDIWEETSYNDCFWLMANISLDLGAYGMKNVSDYLGLSPYLKMWSGEDFARFWEFVHDLI